MPVEPLRVDLSGGRSLTLTPAAKGFPDIVRLVFDDGQDHKRIFADFKINTPTASKTLERELNIGPGEFMQLSGDYVAWQESVQDVLRQEAGVAPATKQTPSYGLKQRTLYQEKKEALSYDAVSSGSGALAVFKKHIEAPDTVIEWENDVIDYIACLDLDFHDPDAPEKLSLEALDELGRILAPAPLCWWRSQGGGIKAIYTATPSDLFTAEELAVGAAAQLLTDIGVLRARGSVEIATKTRHPGALQKGLRCGPVHNPAQHDTFAVLARFSKAEASDDEVQEILDQEGFKLGDRLPHTYCLIDPKHVSSGTPVWVDAEGMYCHSCQGRLGRGRMSWGYVRQRRGMSNSSDRSLAPIREAFENMVHVEHVDYLFAELFPKLPSNLRKKLYKAQLKKTHQQALNDKKEFTQRIDLAFHDFFFVRGINGWLHAGTLLPANTLNDAAVSILPSCVRYNAEEEAFSLVRAQITAHTNNGRIPGWIPIQAYAFEPIFFAHNEAASSDRYVQCRPRVRTTKERVNYVAVKDRMPLDKAEAIISDYFPGVNMLYVKALIIAAGCAESALGGVPMLWATGPTEAAKTTTIRLVLEMYGEPFQDLSNLTEDRLAQSTGDAMRLSRLLVFDDFAKNPSDYRRLHTFVIRLNRGGFTHYKNYEGAETPPFNNAVIFTDWRIPAFFSQDPQFGRRVHLLRLDNRLAVGWDKIGHTVEDWWKRNDELTKAACALHSWMVDNFFPAGDTESFSAKMSLLGIPKLEDEAGSTDTQEAIKELVVELIDRMASSAEEDETTQKRVGRGSRFIDWNKPGTVGATCLLLVESLGKGSSGSRDEDKIHSADNLKHVLDPFQLHLPKMYTFREGIKAVEFEVRSWGSRSYVRLVEAGRATRSRSRSVNGDLFTTWPPVLVPVQVPTLSPLLPLGQAEVDTDEEDAEEGTFAYLNPSVLDNQPPEGPLTAYLDFETQSACSLRKHGGYVYAEHPSTTVMCAAIVVDGRRIYWTPRQHTLQMPPGVEYQWGIEFLYDMVTYEGGCVIVAHNASFERAIWTRTLKLPEPLAWRDTMDRTLAMGLPAGADEAGLTVLGMGKDVEGKTFISKVWGPNSKTGELPPITDYVVQKILNYNFRDTDISIGLATRFGLEARPAWEQSVCDLHHKINHFGICVDAEFARTLRAFDDGFKAIAGDYVEKITQNDEGISAITRADLSRNVFLKDQLNANLPPHLQLAVMQQASLQHIVDLFEEQEEQKTSDEDMSGAISPEVVDVIKCRLTATRAALAKVDKALACISQDGRAKAQLRYHGAATGRWSGYQVQIQNMKRPNEEFDLPAAIAAVERKDEAEFIRLCKDLPPYELLGSLIRGILVPAPGNVFVVGDFASVEARGVLWLAGDEEGLLDYRRKDEADERHPDGKDNMVPDTYQILAGTIFNKSPLEVTKRERGGGKVGILASGFGGGPNAVRRMAAPLGIDLAALGLDPQEVVNGYRTKYRKVQEAWWECERQFVVALTNNRTTTHTACDGRLRFSKYSDRVELTLPSGRAITYWNARMERDPYNDNKKVIVYDNAVNGKTLQRRTYSGKIYENAVQGFCRDLLADVMLRCDAAGAPIAFHVHDEVVLEVPEADADQWSEWLKHCMRTPPAWAAGMPVFSLPCTMKRYGK